MRLIQVGDVGAFELLYKRHGRAAFSLAKSIVRDFAMAEEVVQDAFLTLWRESLRYEPGRGSTRSWTLGIVRNRAIDTLRRKLRSERRETFVEGLYERQTGQDCTELEVARRDQVRTTWARLDVLPSEQQEVIKLAFLGELTNNEIAQALELPLGTVKGRMRLGLQKLHRAYDASPARVEQLAA